MIGYRYQPCRLADCRVGETFKKWGGMHKVLSKGEYFVQCRNVRTERISHFDGYMIVLVWAPYLKRVPFEGFQEEKLWNG